MYFVQFTTSTFLLSVWVATTTLYGMYAGVYMKNDHRMVVRSFGVDVWFTFLFLYAFLLITALKVYMAYQCESHLWNASTGCVPLSALATIAANTNNKNSKINVLCVVGAAF